MSLFFLYRKQKKLCRPTQHFNVTTQCYMFRFAWTNTRHFFYNNLKNISTFEHAIILIWELIKFGHLLKFIKVIKINPQYQVSCRTYSNTALQVQQYSATGTAIQGYRYSNTALHVQQYSATCTAIQRYTYTTELCTCSVTLKHTRTQ
jgi:hypothetical protein